MLEIISSRLLIFRVANKPFPRPGMFLIDQGGERKLLVLSWIEGDVKAGRERMCDAIEGEVKREIPRPLAKVLFV